jgi:propionate CoA-transferase
VLAAPGLLCEVVYGWLGTAPALMRLVEQQQVLAWNLPLGVVSHMLRDCAARRAGPITRVGLGTFVDPRHGGGAANARTAAQPPRVRLVALPGSEQEALW